MDNPECGKYSKWNISLWDDFTMGKPQRSWEKEYLFILGILWSFLRLCGIPQGPLESSRWKTFYYEMISLWKQMCVTHIEGGQMTKETDLRHVLTIFKLWGPNKAPWRYPIVPNGQPSVSWKFEEIFYNEKFHYGHTRWHLHGKWTKDCLMIWGMF